MAARMVRATVLVSARLGIEEVPMTALVAPTSPRDVAVFAWCPTCQVPRACTPSQGTTDWQTTEVYTCRSCGRVTHDPVIRLTGTPTTAEQRA
jgi:hypothetical protein